MPKLKTVLSSLDELDESLHQFYEKNEHGEFIAQLDGLDGHPTVRGLRGALDQTKAQRERYRTQLAVFQPIMEKVGEDGDLDTAVHELAARIGETGEHGDSEADIEQRVKARFEARISAMEAKHSRDLEAARTESQRYRSDLERTKIDQALDQAIARAGIKEGSREVVRDHLKAKGPKLLELGEGEFKGVFPTDIHGVPEANQPIDEYVAEWAKTDVAGNFIPPTGTEGSDAPQPRRSHATGQKVFTGRDLQDGTFDIEAVAKGEATVRD